MLIEKDINSSTSKMFKRRSFINLNGKLIKLDRVLVMGIVNVTPDSFYSDSRMGDEHQISTLVKSMIDSGVDIFDIGGYSTRPGATDVPIEEEIKRLTLGIDTIRKISPNIPISIDTFRSEVVKTLYDQFGGFIVNDISGGDFDPKMFSTVADLGLPYILMHINGTPANMKNLTVKGDVVQTVITELSSKVESLKLLGVNDIIIDPGFGFGKSIEQNFKLLNELDNFKLFELPIVAGISRKSMIWRTLDTTPDKTLNGTSVLNTVAVLNGAAILRVHDVKEASETVQLIDMLNRD